MYIRVHSWFAFFLFGWLVLPCRGETYRTQDEALRLAFPDAEVTRTTVALSKDQAARVEELSGEKPASLLVYPYEARLNGERIGTAYFDAHRVRTLAETVMIVVDPSGRVARIEVLAFNEPREYLAPERWLGQFDGRRLDDDLNLRRGIDGISGATLTARAVTQAARRILAIHQVLGAQPNE